MKRLYWAAICIAALTLWNSVLHGQLNSPLPERRQPSDSAAAPNSEGAMHLDSEQKRVAPAEDEIEIRFDHNGQRWSFSRSRKRRTMAIYGPDKQGNTSRRQIVISKEEWNRLFDPGFSLGSLPSNVISFTGQGKDVTSASIYSICISPGPDYFAVYRNLPKRGVGELTVPTIYRFSLSDTTVTKLTPPQDFLMAPNVNLIQQDTLLIRSMVTERGLILWIYSTNNLTKPKKKIQLVAGDSISNRIIVRKSVSRLLYSRDLQKDYKNPYGRFVSTFGNSIISSYIFKDERGDLVFGLTRYIEERSNTGPLLGNVTYKSGEKYFTLSLRLNPETLEPYDDPNGPVVQEEE